MSTDREIAERVIDAIKALNTALDAAADNNLLVKIGTIDVQEAGRAYPRAIYRVEVMRCVSSHQDYPPESRR